MTSQTTSPSIPTRSRVEAETGWRDRIAAFSRSMDVGSSPDVAAQAVYDGLGDPRTELVTDLCALLALPLHQGIDDRVSRREQIEAADLGERLYESFPHLSVFRATWAELDDEMKAAYRKAGETFLMALPHTVRADVAVPLMEWEVRDREAIGLLQDPDPLIGELMGALEHLVGQADYAGDVTNCGLMNDAIARGRQALDKARRHQGENP